LQFERHGIDPVITSAANLQYLFNFNLYSLDSVTIPCSCERVFSGP